MKTNAPFRGTTVDQALSASTKRPERRIHAPAALNKSIAAYALHAGVGMALSYSERVEAIFGPIGFFLRHLGTLLAALMHILVPLGAAWFASHWNETMEVAVWNGNLPSQLIAFFSLWFMALVGWSALWLGARSLLSKALGAFDGLAHAGENYLASPRRSDPPAPVR